VTDWYSQGYVAPTNIVQASDGYYYALMSVWFPGIPSGWCVIRTAQLDDPAGWRAWSGSAFNLRMTSPYLTGSPAPTCEFLQNTMASGHLVYSTYLNRYLHVAQSWQQIGGRRVCGIYFELSSDLVHWSEEQLLAETNAFDDCRLNPTNPGVLEAMHQGYASIIDHEDTSTNFERAGRTPYLYYARATPVGPQVVRVPLTFTVLD